MDSVERWLRCSHALWWLGACLSSHALAPSSASACSVRRCGGMRFVPSVDDGWISTGKHRLRIQATLPGVDMTFQTAEVPVELSCDAPALNAVDAVIPTPPRSDAHASEPETEPMEAAGAPAPGVGEPKPATTMQAPASSAGGCAAVRSARGQDPSAWWLLCMLLGLALRRASLIGRQF
jgi:hypothetical protein